MNCQKAFSLTVAAGGCSALPASQGTKSLSLLGGIALSDDGSYIGFNATGDVVGDSALKVYTFPALGLLGSEATGINSVPSGASCAWNQTQGKFVGVGATLAGGAISWGIPVPFSSGTITTGNPDTVGVRVVCEGSTAFCATAFYIYKFNCATNAIDATQDYTDGSTFDQVVLDIAWASNVSLIFVAILGSPVFGAGTLALAGITDTFGAYSFQQIGVPAPYTVPLGKATLVYAADSQMLYVIFGVQNDDASAIGTVVTIIDPTDGSTAGQIIIPDKQYQQSGTGFYEPNNHQIGFMTSDSSNNSFLCVVCEDSKTLVGSIPVTTANNSMSSGAAYSVDNSFWFTTPSNTGAGTKATWMGNYRA